MSIEGVTHVEHRALLQSAGLLPGPLGTTALPPNNDTDVAVLLRKHRFVRTEEDDADLASNWETRMVKKYYDSLFKEYCVGEMTYYKIGRIGLRWRTKDEVIAGKGQFICGNLDCKDKKQLVSFEVNFGYQEDGQERNTLIKLRLCPKCGKKLNYKKLQEEREARKAVMKEVRKHIKTVNRRIKKEAEENKRAAKAKKEATKAARDSKAMKARANASISPTKRSRPVPYSSTSRTEKVSTKVTKLSSPPS